MRQHNSQQQGFTVIELIVVMGLIAILAAIVLIALNPARHFAQARNTQRSANVTAILNAISENMAENKGVFKCDNPLPVQAMLMKNNGGGGYDLGACLVPNYLSALPFDPNAQDSHYTSPTDYNTGYYVSQDAATGRVTVSAPQTELNLPVIQVTR